MGVTLRLRFISRRGIRLGVRGGWSFAKEKWLKKNLAVSQRCDILWLYGRSTATSHVPKARAILRNGETD
jgi:hypothetical protein